MQPPARFMPGLPPIFAMLGAAVACLLTPASAQDFKKDVMPFLQKY